MADIFFHDYAPVMKTDLMEGVSPELTNEQLMCRLNSRDDKALEELYRRHVPMLRGIISRILNNEGDIDDIVQIVFLELWNRSEHYSAEKGQALGWIITLARRRAIDKLRRKQAYFRASERMRLEPATNVSHSAYKDVHARELSGIFRKFMSQLPAPQREALHLSYYCGLSQREISTKSGIPLGTIKTRLELAVKKISNAVLAFDDFKGWGRRVPALGF